MPRYVFEAKFEVEAEDEDQAAFGLNAALENFSSAFDGDIEYINYDGPIDVEPQEGKTGVPATGGLESNNKSGKITDGVQMAEILADFANNMYCDVQGFVEQVTLRTHRTIQQSLMGLFLKTIGAWAKMETYDLRNQTTIELAKKIAEMFPNEVKWGLPAI